MRDPWTNAPKPSKHHQARWETPAERRRRENREFGPAWLWAVAGALLALVILGNLPMPV